jgi:hypothetical protein
MTVIPGETGATYGPDLRVRERDVEKPKTSRSSLRANGVFDPGVLKDGAELEARNLQWVRARQ